MADLTLSRTILTLDDLLALGDDVRVEIIDGEIVEMVAAGVVHSILGANIIGILQPFVKQHRIGAVLQDNATFLMFSLSTHLKDSFVPDVAFIRNENVPPGWNPNKPHPGTPDLAIEIVSPGDDAENLQKKCRTYLDKGTQEVWILYKATHEIHQFKSDGTVRVYRDLVEAMDVEALFPGLHTLTLEAIFDLPDWAVTDEDVDG